MPLPPKDLSGQRFGRITLVARDPVRLYGTSHVYRADCDCGTKGFLVSTYELLYRPKRKVRCDFDRCAPDPNMPDPPAVKREHRLTVDLTGKRVGKLVVQKLHTRRPRLAWLCLCDCGSETVVRADALKHERTKSCGCLNREHAKTLHTHNTGKPRKQWWQEVGA